MRDHEQFELLSAYVDGELDHVQVRSIEAHLPTCADCRTMIEAIRATVADLTLLEEPEVDPSISWSLRAQIARARRSPGRFTRAAMALSGVAAVAVAFVAFNNFTGDRAPSTAGLESAGGPQAFARADDSNAMTLPAPNVFVDSGTYSKRSAQTLLAPQPPAFGGEPEAADLEIDWSAVYQTCEPTVKKDPDLIYSVRNAIGSHFEANPALLLVYEVSGGPRETRELWVLHAETCQVLYFAQD